MFIMHFAQAQFGFGFTVSNDLYQRYTNPKDVVGARSSGNAILNLGLGPKIWVGSKKVSASIEAQVNMGFTAFSLSSYQGMGSVSFPMMFKLNFRGVSTFDKEMETGLNIGVGLQKSKTEWYGISKEDYDIGVRRSFFDTYVAQVGYGGGISGFAASLFVRYGFHPDTDASTLNVGLQYDFNRTMMKKIKSPESAL